MSCELSLDQLSDCVGGKIISRQAESFKAVGTDTRADLKGQLFVALRGDSFDAHDFLDKALDKEASVWLLDKEDKAALFKDKVSIVLVPDTLKALQDLSHYWRKQLKAKVIALTGSNGKTTTKEFTKTLISQKYKTHSNKASFNNHWGVPLTLLGANKDDEVVILEMGMNHPGELTELCKIAEPESVVVTNVGRAHFGHFKGLSEIAKAKQEIYSFGESHIFNLDNNWTAEMIKPSAVKNKIYFSSKDKAADIYFEIESSDIEGIKIKGSIKGLESSATVPVFGEHNLENLMAACALALSVGVDPEKLWKALSMCQNTWGRSQYFESPQNYSILFDAYNSNPESFKTLVDNVFKLSKNKRKFFVVGDMLEMGDKSAAVHREIGEYLGRAQPQGVWFVGSEKDHFEAGMKASKFKKSLIITNTYDISLAKEVENVLQTGDILVVKASRGLKLERLLDDLGIKTKA